MYLYVLIARRETNVLSHVLRTPRARTAPSHHTASSTLSSLRNSRIGEFLTLNTRTYWLRVQLHATRTRTRTRTYNTSVRDVPMILVARARRANKLTPMLTREPVELT